MTDEQVFICEVCRHTLTLYMDDEGAAYRHAPQDDDHEPVPVRSADMAPRCDFCGIDAVAFRLPVQDFELPMPSGMDIYQSTGEWGVCEECGHLIEADKWAAVLHRAAALSAERDAPWPVQVRAKTWGLYSALREHITGPLRPVP